MTTAAPAPKQRSTGRTILTIFLVLIVLCVVCAVGALVLGGPAVANIFNSIAQPLVTSNDFMTAVKAQDYTKAYGMIHPSQQASFGGSPDGMKQLFASKGMEPTTFTLTNIQLTGDATVNGIGTFGGSQKYVYISLRKDGDTWKILGLQINDNAPTATPTS